MPSGGGDAEMVAREAVADAQGRKGAGRALCWQHPPAQHVNKPQAHPPNISRGGTLTV